MSRYVLGKRSRERLDTCHPVLVRLVERVFASDRLPMDVVVLCGHRDKAGQDAAVAARTSRLAWPRSKHNKLPSMAVDLAPYVGGRASWEWEHYHMIAPVVKAEWSAMEAEGLTEGLRLTWGGDWTSFKDGPHWELG